MQDVVIIKYNAGNIRSMLFSLKRLGVNAIVTDDSDQIRQASHVIFPGVGAANSAMPYLIERKLDQLILSLKQPFLGVCLGMQLMCKHSQEGETDCLGIFEIPVIKFEDSVKVPHMGWNKLRNPQSAIMETVADGEYAYFVHSYYAVETEYTIATTDYGLKFSSALHKDNFYGVQFHPEKSAKTGEKILTQFLML